MGDGFFESNDFRLMKKPNWIIQAEQDIEGFSDTPLMRLSAKQLNAFASGIKCKNCGGIFNSVNIVRHNKVCQDLLDREQLILDLHKQGLSSLEISKQVKIQQSQLTELFDKHGLVDNWIAKRKEIEEKALELYDSGNKNYTKIAEILGENPLTIKGILTDRNGLVSERTAHTEEKDKRILELYHNGTRPSSADIARETGYQENSVKSTLQKYKLTAWSIIKTKENKAKIIELYQQGYQQKEIKEIVGVSHGTVSMTIIKYREENEKA